MAQAPRPPPDQEEQNEGPEEEEGQEGGGAAKLVAQIQDGFKQLGAMLQHAQDQVDPQDIKLFQAAVQATDNFIQAMSGGGEQQAPGRPQQSGPMDSNANATAQMPGTPARG